MKRPKERITAEVWGVTAAGVSVSSRVSSLLFFDQLDEVLARLRLGLEGAVAHQQHGVIVVQPRAAVGGDGVGAVGGLRRIGDEVRLIGGVPEQDEALAVGGPARRRHREVDRHQGVRPLRAVHDPFEVQAVARRLLLGEGDREAPPVGRDRGAGDRPAGGQARLHAAGSGGDRLVEFDADLAPLAKLGLQRVRRLRREDRRPAAQQDPALAGRPRRHREAPRLLVGVLAAAPSPAACRRRSPRPRRGRAGASLSWTRKGASPKVRPSGSGSTWTSG